MAHTRQDLLDAAERLLREKGLASTREIAREAGCADGTLYNHFKDRTGLYLAVLFEKIPDFSAPLHELPLRVGEGSVAANLAGIGHAAVRFYHKVAPLFGALFAEPQMLAAYRAALRGQDRGPHRSAGAVAAYLRAEQRLGRVDAQRDVAAAAEALFGACFQHSFRYQFMGLPEDAAADERFVCELVQTLVLGLAPRAADSPDRAPF